MLIIKITQKSLSLITSRNQYKPLMLKCLIVDDEELARTLLETYIQRLPFLELVGKCKNPLEAIAILQQQPVDLLLLDIQMPELSGIDLLKTLKNKPLTIFTTAYEAYALEGYNLDVVDYLLKPIAFERFLQAVNKVLERSSQQPSTPEMQATTLPAKDFILIKSDHKIHRLPLEEITYIQSMREYVAYYTANGRILALGSLKSLEENLPAERFQRIHKSYIVALDKVKSLEGNMLHVAGERLPIGANYKDEVVKRIFTV